MLALYARLQRPRERCGGRRSRTRMVPRPESPAAKRALLGRERLDRPDPGRWSAAAAWPGSASRLVPDPGGSPQVERYWDGGAWTDHYRPQKTSRGKWIAAIVAGVLIVAGIIIALVVTSGGSKATHPPPESTTPSASTTPATTVVPSTSRVPSTIRPSTTVPAQTTVSSPSTTVPAQTSLSTSSTT
jgi:hypothetical protein